MATSTLIELADRAMTADGPACTSRYIPKLGGVDPLGLRQINFDLMDMVLPGLNNIARHIRPFTVVAWAWRRAATRAHELGMISVPLSELQDFVDRIEVIYVWSQFLRNPNADLPGRDVLASLVNGPDYLFGGEAWNRRREIRDDSTALSAAINYGPTLKALGWLEPDAAHSGAMRASQSISEALTAFEAQITDLLSHPAFSSFGEVRVTTAEAKQWASAWALDQPTPAERKAMAESLAGDTAQARRRDGIKLITDVVGHLGKGADERSVRRTMCGTPTDFVPVPERRGASDAWRTLQVRQAFRLSVEALLYWVLQQLDHGPMMTSELVEAFLKASGDAATTREWLVDSHEGVSGPADWIDRLEKSLASAVDLPATIRSALAASLRDAPDSPGTERDDRLPLARAAQQSRDWKDENAKAFMTHVFDSWIFGQHVYWSVGRGLADARSQGKTILRLKVVLEEGGWTMAPGATAAASNAPGATPDRLETALSLMREADLIT